MSGTVLCIAALSLAAAAQKKPTRQECLNIARQPLAEYTDFAINGTNNGELLLTNNFVETCTRNYQWPEAVSHNLTMHWLQTEMLLEERMLKFIDELGLPRSS